MILVLNGITGDVKVVCAAFPPVLIEVVDPEDVSLALYIACSLSWCGYSRDAFYTSLHVTYHHFTGVTIS